MNKFTATLTSSFKQIEITTVHLIKIITIFNHDVDIFWQEKLLILLALLFKSTLVIDFCH